MLSMKTIWDGGWMSGVYLVELVSVLVSSLFHDDAAAATMGEVVVAAVQEASF